MFTTKRIILSLLLFFASWIVIDLSYPFKTNIAKIDAAETARLEGAMWRSYYEKKQLKLFLQSAELMRNEFNFPLWRSYRVAYYAAKAAFVFKDGKSRKDYEKALPYLRKYYGQINDTSQTPFNADSAARIELEWWIIRREREIYSPSEWENLLTQTASVVYRKPAVTFKTYAALRVQAMLLRDKKGNAITEADWKNIHNLLLKAWQSFALSLKKEN